ncbi:MAG TPA: SMC-Scp complex subunit ScpB [Planctomycetaceae bacterium]|nr:SMC-Scp complex subunit ScpB [Planctomycetaceae bacterium]
MSRASFPEGNEGDGREVSLEQLGRAYAQVLGGRRTDQPDQTPAAEGGAEAEGAAESQQEEERAVQAEGAVPLSPESILEAMLFVGSPDNRPLSCTRAAELMRGVEPGEIPQLVDRLNRRYAARGCPYHIVGEGDGYRLTLRKQFNALRLKFHGKLREARLSQAAIDVLAIVAYRQPLSAEEVNRLRGKASNHILAQLVRRQLLRVERPRGARRRTVYWVADRFLELFGLESLDELPRAEDLDSH